MTKRSQFKLGAILPCLISINPKKVPESSSNRVIVAAAQMSIHPVITDLAATPTILGWPGARGRGG